MKFTIRWTLSILCCLTIWTFVVGCGYTSGDTPQKEETQCYYPEKWEIENLPEKHIEILQFYHAEKCDTCKKLEYTIKKVLQEKYPQHIALGIVMYHGVATNYIENTSLKQTFSVMEEDLFGSLWIEGTYVEKEHWDNIFQMAESEQLEDKIQLRIDALLIKLSQIQ